MYQSESFYVTEPVGTDIFCPVVTSVFKVLSDNSYFHYCDEEEQMNHPDKTIAFIRCNTGIGKIYLKDKNLELKANECVFISFHDIVKYKSLSNVWGYRWVNFLAPHACEEFEFNKIYKIPFSENEDKAFGKLLCSGQSDFKNKSYINSLFLSYFYSVMIEGLPDKKEIFLSSGTRLIDEICAYIQQKLYSKISIEDIALFFNISPRRLHQIFTKELNISPKKYIVKKKMEEGYKLLVQTSAPINKIAYMLCFSSPYHFTNEFKKTFGQSPSEVRKMEQISKKEVQK